MRRKKIVLSSLGLVMAMVLSACGTAEAGTESEGGEEIQGGIAVTETEDKSEVGSEDVTTFSMKEKLNEAEEEISDTEISIETFHIPDINYDNYIFDDEGNKIIGYNIPEGYTVDEDSSSERYKVFLENGTSHSPFCFWADIPKAIENLKEYTNEKEIHELEFEDGTSWEYTVEEIQSVQTPYGEFRVFNIDYIETEGESIIDAIIAILPIDNERGIQVRCDTFFETKKYDVAAYVYSGTMEELLMELFGEEENVSKNDIVEETVEMNMKME
ncbi:MAG: hypothetical protein IJO97_05985 [Lachnospiraceae bacterium]|nr:hypothetical protein [Lachnospiraceae bacterium]